MLFESLVTVSQPLNSVGDIYELAEFLKSQDVKASADVLDVHQNVVYIQMPVINTSSGYNVIRIAK